MKCFPILLIFTTISFTSCKESTKSEKKVASATNSSTLTCEYIPSRFTIKVNAPKDMVWIPGGEFIMGTNDKEAYDQEKPAHPVRVTAFFMDITEAANSQFKKFTDATGYITVAEKKPNWKDLKKQLPPDTPKPTEEALVPASLVFVPPTNTITVDDIFQWWKFVPEANWKHPEGPNSNIDNRMNHPIVHIAYEDALAYCKWTGKRLPTETEWEFAARGGLDQNRYAWGDQFKCNEKNMANTFQGKFPEGGLAEDGFLITSPVETFPANGYGLMDMDYMI